MPVPGLPAWSTELFERFERAAATGGDHRVTLDLGGDIVEVRVAGRGLLSRLLPALEHRTVAADADAAHQLLGFDGTTTGAWAPLPFPWGPDAYGERGLVRGANSGGFRTLLQPGVDVLQHRDDRRGAGLVFVRRPDDFPWWEDTFPFRTLLHWAWHGRPGSPMHAGAVTVDGRGLLVAGPSGAGKSSVTLACARAGFGFLGDDYVLVTVGRLPKVHPLYRTGKVEPHNLERFPELVSHVRNPDRLGVQKAVVFADDVWPDCLASAAPIQAIVVPRVVGTGTSRLSVGATASAVNALAPTTLIQLPGDEDRVSDVIRQLVAAVPIVHLDVGADLREVPDLLAGLVAESAA